LSILLSSKLISHLFTPFCSMPILLPVYYHLILFIFSLTSDFDLLFKEQMPAGYIIFFSPFPPKRRDDAHLF